MLNGFVSVPLGKAGKAFCSLLVVFGVVLMCLLFPCKAAWASGDHGDGHSHSHEETATKDHQEIPYFSVENASEKYEVLLRYAPFEAGEAIEMTLFVSNYATNKPISAANLHVSIPEDANLQPKVTQKDSGIYIIKIVFPKEQEYSLSVSINSSLGADQLLLHPIEVGKDSEMAADKHEAEHEHSASAADEHEHPHTHWWASLWLWIPVSLVAGIFITHFLGNRRSKRLVLIGFFSSSLLSLYSLPLNVYAHGDEGHGKDKKNSASFSNNIIIPKETQFLFDVSTEKIQTGSFTENLKFFGTIIPSSSGQAVLAAPQAGTVISLQTRVGEQVKAGQVLAVIEQYIDANTQATLSNNQSADLSLQISLESERNALVAELEAARKEHKRLQTIADIAAQKDIDESILRLQKAETNLALYNTAHTQKRNFSVNKNTTIKAPISGTVGAFLITMGSSVSAGQELFTITNIDKVYIEAQVFDKDMDKLSNSKSYIVECAGNDHKTGAVKLLTKPQSMNTTNQSQKILFELANTDRLFKLGEFVNIRAQIGTKAEIIALPKRALSEINGKPVVFVKKSAEIYEPSYVQTGNDNGEFIVIQKGIEQGERIVDNGSYQIKMIYLNQ